MKMIFAIPKQITQIILPENKYTSFHVYDIDRKSNIRSKMILKNSS